MAGSNLAQIDSSSFNLTRIDFSLVGKDQCVWKTEMLNLRRKPEKKLGKFISPKELKNFGYIFLEWQKI